MALGVVAGDGFDGVVAVDVVDEHLRVLGDGLEFLLDDHLDVFVVEMGWDYQHSVSVWVWEASTSSNGRLEPSSFHFPDGNISNDVFDGLGSEGLQEVFLVEHGSVEQEVGEFSCVLFEAGDVGLELSFGQGAFCVEDVTSAALFIFWEWPVGGEGDVDDPVVWIVLGDFEDRVEILLDLGLGTFEAAGCTAGLSTARGHTLGDRALSVGVAVFVSTWAVNRKTTSKHLDSLVDTSLDLAVWDLLGLQEEQPSFDGPDVVDGSVRVVPSADAMVSVVGGFLVSPHLNELELLQKLEGFVEVHWSLVDDVLVAHELGSLGDFVEDDDPVTDSSLDRHVVISSRRLRRGPLEGVECVVLTPVAPLVIVRVVPCELHVLLDVFVEEHVACLTGLGGHVGPVMTEVSSRVALPQ